MTVFDKLLFRVLGPRHTEFSKDLRERLFELWSDGFEMGTGTPHTCGGFDPSTEGPVGPEGCDACKTLNEGP